MTCKLVDVVDVKVLNDYRLQLKFDDDSEGSVDISELISFKGIFKPLNDMKFFATVHINTDIGTICWENGADLSPNYLHAHLQPH